MALLTLNTRTEIANAALAKLKHGKRFTDLDTATGDAAEHARQFFQLALDETTTARRWKFAEAVQQYTTPVTTAAYSPLPYINAFQLPDDALRLYEVYPKDCPHRPENMLGYDRRGNLIYAEPEAIEVVYTARITDLAQPSPLFIDAVITRLSYHLAVPIANNAKLQDAMMTAFLRGVNTAFAHEADDPHASEEQTPTGIAARRG